MIPRITQNTFGIIKYSDLYASYTTDGWKSSNDGFENMLNKMTEANLSRSVGYVPLQDVSIVMDIARVLKAEIVFLASERDELDRVF